MSAMSELDILAGMLPEKTSAELREMYRQLDDDAIRGMLDDCYDILTGDYGDVARAELEGLLGRVYVADQLRLDLDCQGYALIREDV